MLHSQYHYHINNNNKYQQQIYLHITNILQNPTNFNLELELNFLKMARIHYIYLTSFYLQYL